MLSDKDWVRIRSFVDQVCNRESDYTIVYGMRITRYQKDINVHLFHDQLDLEPDPEDMPPGGE